MRVLQCGSRAIDKTSHVAVVFLFKMFFAMRNNVRVYSAVSRAIVINQAMLPIGHPMAMRTGPLYIYIRRQRNVLILPRLPFQFIICVCICVAIR